MTRKNFILKFIIGILISIFPFKSEFEKNIGKKVAKLESKKPFKSRLKINTVKGVINHPILNIPAYIFIEDNSYVECRRCTVVDYET